MQNYLYSLTNYIQVAHLTLHWVRVDLAHIPSPIRFPHVTYVQVPRPVFAVRHSDSVILGNNVAMDCQDRLCIHP